MNGDGNLKAWWFRAEDEIFKAIDSLRDIADDLGIHIAQLSIAWILAKPGIACALVGSRNKEELMTNIGAIEVDLSPEIVAEIDS